MWACTLCQKVLARTGARVSRHHDLLDEFVAALGARISQRAQTYVDRVLVTPTDPRPAHQSAADPSVKPQPSGERWRTIEGSSGEATGLSVHPTAPRVAVVTNPIGSGQQRVGKLHVIDPRTDTSVFESTLSYQPWCAAYHPSGTVLAIGTNEGRVLLLETDGYAPQVALTAHDSYVYSLAWTPDGTRLVTASGDATVRVWDSRPRVESRLHYERWTRLRNEMAARDDLEQAFAAITGEARQAARIERVRRAHGL